MQSKSSIENNDDHLEIDQCGRYRLKYQQSKLHTQNYDDLLPEKRTSKIIKLEIFQPRTWTDKRKKTRGFEGNSLKRYPLGPFWAKNLEVNNSDNKQPQATDQRQPCSQLATFWCATSVFADKLEKPLVALFISYSSIWLWQQAPWYIAAEQQNDEPELLSQNAMHGG